MTDKLKCPFCGEKLQTHTMTPGCTLICVNKGCPVDSVVMKRIVWQALIDGKKAQDSLKEISQLNQYIREELAHQIPEETSNVDNSIYTITFEIAKECRKGLHNKIEEESDDR